MTNQDAFGRRIQAMHDRIQLRIGNEPMVVYYSAYDLSDRLDLPVSNLNEIPIRGKVRFHADADEFYGGKISKGYDSPVLDSPNWLAIAVLADAMIRTVGDLHHIFLEGVEVIDEEKDGVKVAEFVMGS